MTNWLYVLNVRDVWNQAKAGEITTQQCAKLIARRIRNTFAVLHRKYLAGDPEVEHEDWIGMLMECAEELECISDDPDEFDEIWDRIYNIADYVRIWVATV